MSQQLIVRGRRNSRRKSSLQRKLRVSLTPGLAQAAPALAYPGYAEAESDDSRRALVTGSVSALIHLGAIGVLLFLASLAPVLDEELIPVQLLRDEGTPEEAAPAPKALAERRSRHYAPAPQTMAPQVVNPRVVAAATPAVPPELLMPTRSKSPKWQSGGKPGRWTTIGCGLGIVMLLATLFAGSNLLKRTVWSGYAGTRNRIVNNLPGDLPPGERMRLTRNLDRFSAQLRIHDDPYPIMGEFQKLARVVFEDRVITRDEVGQLNVFLEEHLPGGPSDVPYSMP